MTPILPKLRTVVHVAGAQIRGGFPLREIEPPACHNSTIMPNTTQQDAPASASQPTYRAEYARRMNRVLDHIDRHLASPFDLTQLADVANFSRFHFHRVFAAWMGETLGDYARRRRLEVAAMRLSCVSSASVLDTALATGFGSGEAFARAFKLKFGCTPTAWRHGSAARRSEQMAAIRARQAARESNPDQVPSNLDQAPPAPLHDHGHSTQSNGENNMEVRVIDLPAVRVAYQRTIGPYGPAIGTFWRDSVAPWMAAHGLGEQLCFGIGHDDPCITPPDKCRYDACVAVPDGFVASGQVNVCVLPGGRYAVADFKGHTANIGDAWMTLLREWLPSSGMQCDERPCFEQFLAASAIDARTGAFNCALCIPVRPL
jgi:AraC family transcriptional regulator